MAADKKLKPLNSKQQRFCNEVMICEHAYQAYEKTYGEQSSKALARSSAARLLNNTSIKAEIKALQEEAAQNTAITSKVIIGNLVRVMKQGQAIDPILDHKGNETGYFKFDHKAVLGATAQLSKMLGFDTHTPTFYQEEITTIDQAKTAVSKALYLYSTGQISNQQYNNVLNAAKILDELIKTNEIAERIAAIEEELKA